MSWFYRGRKNPLKRIHLLIGEFAPLDPGNKKGHVHDHVNGSLARLIEPR